MEPERNGARLLPTQRSRKETQAQLDALEPWFYSYRFENGAATQAREHTQAIHDTRARLIFPFLDDLLAGRWQSTRCLDIGCHEGWFSAQLAVRGAGEVLATDIRPEHLERAAAVQRLAGLERVRIEGASLLDLAARGLEPFDVTFFVGVLYHLPNPIEAIQAVRALTRGVAVIETQVARAAPPLHAAWGSGSHRSGPGMALLPSDASHVEPGEPLVLVPTLDALYALLHGAGFERIYLSVPDDTMEEQYRTYDRVVVFAGVGSPQAA